MCKEKSGHSSGQPQADVITFKKDLETIFNRNPNQAFAQHWLLQTWVLKKQDYFLSKLYGKSYLKLCKIIMNFYKRHMQVL